MNRNRAMWGLLLIIAGILWILVTAGSVQMDIMGSVRTLWPVFVVAFGINLMMKKDARPLRTLVWILAAVVILGYALYLGAYGDSQYDGHRVDVYEYREGMEYAKLELDAGVADIRIKATDSELAKISSDINGIRSSYESGSESIIRYRQRWRPVDLNTRGHFNADLSRAVKWNLEINTGSADGIVDFSGFPMKTCEINTGVCDIRFVAGSLQDETTIRCNAGTVTISISLPEGTGIRIESNAAINDVNGNGISLIKRGRYYESTNFDSSDRVVNMYINGGTADITVNVL